MSETKTTKGTKKVNTKATKSQEDKVMKKVEQEVVKNEATKNEFISIEEVTKLYAEAGIKCKNPNAKGSYRIMNGGSSLNLKPKKGYIIYTSNDDLDLINAAKLEYEDLVIGAGTNAQDKVRPNTVMCTALGTLIALLALYAKNPMNQIPVAAEA